MSKEKVIEIARGELGVTEFPAGSNCVKYNTAYYGREVSGSIYKWCVNLLWWLFREAGESAAFFGGAKTASCGTLLRYYREMGQTVAVEHAQPADIVICNFSGKKVGGMLDTEHCGLVVERHGEGAGLFLKTIEGNTSPGEEGSQDNGGCVALKTRYPSQIVAVCRPQYKPEDSKPVDDVTGHWAEHSIRRVMARGLLRGYPDGSFGPDKPVTRAELAAVLDRLNKEDEK